VSSRDLGVQRSSLTFLPWRDAPFIVCSSDRDDLRRPPSSLPPYRSPGSARTSSPRSPNRRSTALARLTANAVSKMHNVCRTGLPRICVVMLIMHLELALSFQLQPHSRRQTVAALYKFGGDPRASPRIAMQVAEPPARASARPSVHHPVPLPAPPPSIAHCLSSPKASPKGADQPPAPERVWVQVVRGGEAVGRAGGVWMARPSLLDDLCTQVHSQYPSLAELAPAQLFVSTSLDPKDEAAQLTPEITVEDALTNERAGCAYDSPLYVHAPVGAAPLRPAPPAPPASARRLALLPCPPQPCTPPALLPRRRVCHVAPPSHSAADGLASVDEVQLVPPETASRAAGNPAL